MTRFDPAFALRVMQRRMDDRNREASRLLWDKYDAQLNGELSPFSIRADVIDKKVHALWDQADSYIPVIEYLEERIWSEKSNSEKVWETMRDWAPNIGPGMIDDVAAAQEMVDAGFRA